MIDGQEVYLENENYNVFTCHSAAEAVDCIESKNIDIAILDVMLPDADGFSICKRIKQNHLYPIIVLTAKDAEIDKINGLALGADDYVTKSVLYTEFKSTLLDNTYMRIKNRMLCEIAKIDGSIIYLFIPILCHRFSVYPELPGHFTI